jgi:glutathione S-transferase
MSDIKLFGSRLSPYVEKVARALALKGLDYELVTPRSPTEFRRWNPQTGKMPVLEVKGERLWDSTFILRRLEELEPTPPLVAADPVVAAAQRQLEDWSDESLYWMLMALRWVPRNADASVRQLVDSMPVPGFAKPVARLLVARQIGNMPRVQGFGRLPAEILERELGLRLDDLVTLLGDRPFFYAERPSVADLGIFGMLATGTSGPTPEVDRALDERPVLREWRKRLEQATGG